LSLASSCNTRKSTVAAYTVRFLPVWNPVMEGKITICTLSTVLTNFIHIIFKPGPILIIKTKSKIWIRAKTIIITHNCQTYTWPNHYDG